MQQKDGAKRQRDTADKGDNFKPIRSTRRKEGAASSLSEEAVLPSSDTGLLSEGEKLADGSLLRRVELPGAVVYLVTDLFPEGDLPSLYEELRDMDCWSYEPIIVFGRQVMQKRKTASFTLPNIIIGNAEKEKTDLDDDDDDDDDGSDRPRFQKTADEIKRDTPALVRYRYSGRENVGLLSTPAVAKIHHIIEHWLSDALPSDVLTQLFGEKRKGEGGEQQQRFTFVLANYYADGSEVIGMHSDDEKELEGPIFSVSFGSPRFFDFKGRANDAHAAVSMRLTLTPGSLLLMGPGSQAHYKHGIPMQKKIKGGRISLTFRKLRTTQ